MKMIYLAASMLLSAAISTTSFASDSELIPLKIEVTKNSLKFHPLTISAKRNSDTSIDIEGLFLNLMATDDNKFVTIAAQAYIKNKDQLTNIGNPLVKTAYGDTANITFESSDEADYRIAITPLFSQSISEP